ncbi:MAG: SMEK domain-containing protein [Thermodesulfovibrionales bacterium]|nr:SMEK domain-containing protein [Thermodesulfovibrionales bacterium]
MQNLETIHKITHLLSQWRVYTELSSSIQLNDVNNTNEDLGVLLLNKIYGWKLENLNKNRANFPAIDLGDSENKIGVSITATNTSMYISEKIKTNIKHKIYETFTNHYFFITTKKKDYTTEFDTEGKYAFDKTKNIIDIEDLLKATKNLPIEIQQEVLSILESNVSKFKGNFIEDITPQDIAKMLNEFSAQNPSLINSISDTIRKIQRTDFSAKNKINNLSEGYIKLIQQQSLPFFEQFRVFLEKFENRDFKKIYFNITSDLQKVILVKRTEYEKFDDIFAAIEETYKAKVPALVADRRTLQILLHFMYFQCDIGESRNDNAR